MLHSVRVQEPGRLYLVSCSRRTVTEIRVKDGGPVVIVPLDKNGGPSERVMPSAPAFAALRECGPVVVEGRFALRLAEGPPPPVAALVDYRFFRMGRPSPER